MMREVNLNDFPQEIASKIREKFPLGEDIAILDKEGSVVSVIIGVKPYKYLLAKIEEDEEIIDLEELKNFDTKKEINKSVDFDDFMKGD